jgi:hypothetical protein
MLVTPEVPHGQMTSLNDSAFENIQVISSTWEIFQNDWFLIKGENMKCINATDDIKCVPKTDILTNFEHVFVTLKVGSIECFE